MPTAKQITDNIEAKILAIIPALDAASGSARQFVPMPDNRPEDLISSRPSMRQVLVRSDGGSIAPPYGDQVWTTEETFRVTVAYALDRPLNELFDRIRSDIRDIAAQLATEVNWLNGTAVMGVAGWVAPIFDQPPPAATALLQDILVYVQFQESSVVPST